jgi:hypothetical protein
LCDFEIGQFMVVSTNGFCGLGKTGLPHVPCNGFCVSKTTCKLSVLDGFYLLSKLTVSSNDSTPLGLPCYGVSSSYPIRI